MGRGCKQAINSQKKHKRFNKQTKRCISYGNREGDLLTKTTVLKPLFGKGVEKQASQKKLCVFIHIYILTYFIDF